MSSTNTAINIPIILATAVQLYSYILLARIIMSWIKLPSSPTLNKIYNFIYDVTEPFLRIFRGVIPVVMIGGVGLDLSPMVAFIILQLLKEWILRF